MRRVRHRGEATGYAGHAMHSSQMRNIKVTGEMKNRITYLPSPFQRTLLSRTLIFAKARISLKIKIEMHVLNRD